jgi:hypothetical protein
MNGLDYSSTLDSDCFQLILSSDTLTTVKQCLGVSRVSRRWNQEWHKSRWPTLIQCCREILSSLTTIHTSYTVCVCQIVRLLYSLPFYREPLLWKAIHTFYTQSVYKDVEEFDHDDWHSLQQAFHNHTPLLCEHQYDFSFAPRPNPADEENERCYELSKALIHYDPLSVKYLSSACPERQLLAVQLNPQCIRVVEKQTRELCEAALTLEPSLFVHVHHSLQIHFYDLCTLGALVNVAFLSDTNDERRRQLADNAFKERCRKRRRLLN